MRRQQRTTEPLGAPYWPAGCPRPGTPGWERLPWPESVPVLKPRDATRQHDYPIGRPPYNLDGWLEVTFPAPREGPAQRLQLAAEAVLAGVVSRRAGRRLAVWEYSWERGVTPADLAAAWNEAMALLGYDPAPEPEIAYAEFFT